MFDLLDLFLLTPTSKRSAFDLLIMVIFLSVFAALLVALLAVVAPYFS